MTFIRTLLLSSKKETCVHCGRRLRPNGLLRNAPCGRRVVFDPERGRVWVVCHRCDGWNLTPLETRAGALRECEQLASTALLRDTSGGVDRARVGGVELVRVGSMEDDGLALFRYSARVRRRELVMKGLGFSIMGIIMAGPTAVMLWNHINVMVPPVTFASLIALSALGRAFFGRSVVTRSHDENGAVHTVRKLDLATAMLVRGPQPGAWRLSVTTSVGQVHFVKEEALRVLRVALAASVHGVTPGVLEQASRFLRETRLSSPDSIFAALAQEAPDAPSQKSLWGVARPGTIHLVPLYQRVALEIASTAALDRASALEDARRTMAGLGESEVRPPLPEWSSHQ